MRMTPKHRRGKRAAGGRRGTVPRDMGLADMGQQRRQRELFRWVAMAVVLAMMVGSAWVFVAARSQTRITAYFTSTVGIYPDSEVRILGVPVGTVDSVQPRGKQVEVGLVVDGDVTVPANANATVITPSVVADRYVQLAPSYQGGPTMSDGAEIPVARTATPVEVDELFESLNQLTKALGPDGANSDGAVSELLRTGAEYLSGNGSRIGDAIRQLGELARTLGGSKEDLFDTVDNLSKFTGMLATNNGQVEQFGKQLASITKVLADDRDQISGALHELTEAMRTVKDFIKNNREKVKSNVDNLTEVTRTLVKQKESLTEALDAVPNALTNLLNAYNPASKTIDARANLLEYKQAVRSADAPRLPLPSTDTRHGGGR